MGQTTQHRDQWITIEHAQTNNLQGVSVRVPKHRLTVFTGISGSGKSSLVFGTIAAEAQRLVADSYSLFVRNRLPSSGHADVERIDGLTFTVVIDQRRFTGNARSTVGTASDIAPLLRVLFSRVGKPSAGYSPAYSFNNPSGMCPTCEGLGTINDIDLDKLLDRSRTLNGGAIRFPAFKPGTYRWKRMVHAGLFDPDLPLSQWPPHSIDTLLYARNLPLENPDPQYPKTSLFDGVIPRIQDSYLRKTPSHLTSDERIALNRIVMKKRCPQCDGTRLNAAARASLIDGRSITDWSALPVSELSVLVQALQDEQAQPVIDAIRKRLNVLDAVGLGYLTLDRPSQTLSGGEAQRVKIIRHLTSALSDVTYVFDEPSAGLHPHDVHRLVRLLTQLRDAHNTVLVVEHCPAVIVHADHVIDLGPGAGTQGGQVRFEGTPQALLSTNTLTGQMLRQPLVINTHPRSWSQVATVKHAHIHNLRDLTVDFPLGVLTAVTGIAGSGKTSLAAEELPRQHPEFAVIASGPLPGGSRSTPATVLDIAEPIRQSFATANGISPSWFSPNARGACLECKGKGLIVTDLAFLDNVNSTCEACNGTGFNQIALAATLDQYSIADVLDMHPKQASKLFSTDAQISQRLHWLEDVGLGYLTIGQKIDTLSGGERQRLLLAKYLCTAVISGDVCIVLDEPTAGLHSFDVDKLLSLFNKLINQGATIVAIEHNQNVIAHADHVIDLGPGAGHEGGTIVYQGPPAGILKSPTSITGAYLKHAKLKHPK